MHTEPTTPTARTRRGRALATALAIGASTAITVLGATSPATAAVGPQPEASFSFECGGQGGGTVGTVHATLGNADGQATAHFTYTATGSAPSGFDAAPGQVAFLTFPVDTDHAPWTIAVAADLGAVASQTFDVDCGTSVPTIPVEIDETTTTTTVPATVPVEVDETTTTTALPSTSTTAATTPEISTPEDPAPPATPTTDPVVVGAGQALPPAPTAARPAVHREALARTGANSVALVTVGLTLIGLGTVLLARRRALARR